jgi:hypothetical protein
MFLETANAATLVVSFIIPFSCKDRNFSTIKKMISKKIQSDPVNFLTLGFPWEFNRSSCPQQVRSDSAADDERVPSGMPLGVSGKFWDVRKTFGQQKTESFWDSAL